MRAWLQARGLGYKRSGRAWLRSAVGPTTMDEHFAETEDDCAVCGAWPQADRARLRKDNNCLPLREPICDACIVSFWKAIRR